MKLNINYRKGDVLGRLKRRQNGKKKQVNRQEKIDRKNRRMLVKKIIGNDLLDDKRNLTKNKVIKREESRGGVSKAK